MTPLNLIALAMTPALIILLWITVNYFLMHKVVGLLNTYFDGRSAPLWFQIVVAITFLLWLLTPIAWLLVGIQYAIIG